jgi:transcriptional regulator with XRE-family HTH domain
LKISGKNFKIALRSLDISQEEIAKRLNTTRQTLSKWFKYEEIPEETLQNVKSEFAIDLSQFTDEYVGEPGNDKNKKKKEGLIPFYNADFIAGNAELYYDDETIYPEYYMDVPEFSGSTAFRAFGDSMEPRIKSGNILFGTKRDNWNLYLEFGQIYGITCKDGSRFLKYIRKHSDKNMLLLKSENPNYDDMDMPKSEIKNIWLINGWIDKRT